MPKRIRHRVRATLRRERKFIVYVTPEEYQRIARAVRKLAGRSFSDGARQLLLDKCDETEVESQ